MVFVTAAKNWLILTDTLPGGEERGRLLGKLRGCTEALARPRFRP